MAKLDVDTDKIRVAGEDINVIANDYVRIINDMFNKISSIEQSGIWTSESSSGAAKKYISNVLKDRESFLALGTDMKNLGNKVISYANNINVISESKL